jgi:hypothetical protein
MNRTPLKSRLIDSVAYNTETSTLHVWLRSKKHEIYLNVSMQTYQNLISAPSPGFYYSYYIATKGRKRKRNLATMLLNLAAGYIFRRRRV